MKNTIIFIVGIIVGVYIYHNITHNINSLGDSILNSDISHTGSVIMQYLQISPVKKIASLEVTTTHHITDDYFQNYKVLGFDTPTELDKFVSQMKISGKVQVRAIYGYISSQITNSDPHTRGTPQLLYYEILDNNIQEVISGIGISNDKLVKRIVNTVLQTIHGQLKKDFSQNTGYILQAQKNALCNFANACN